MQPSKKISPSSHSVRRTKGWNLRCAANATVKVLNGCASRRSAVLNEDEEDSAESSTDDEAEVTTYVASDVE